MELDELSRDVDQAAVALERTARRLPLAGGRPVGAGGPGQLGAVGGALASLYDSALAARRHEVNAAGLAATGLAEGLRRVAAAYRDVDGRSGRS